VDNEFFAWPQLQHADDPSLWEGVESFSTRELDVVRELARVGRMEPGYAV